MNHFKRISLSLTDSERRKKPSETNIMANCMEIYDYMLWRSKKTLFPFSKTPQLSQRD